MQFHICRLLNRQHMTSSGGLRGGIHHQSSASSGSSSHHMNSLGMHMSLDDMSDTDDDIDVDDDVLDDDDLLSDDDFTDHRRPSRHPEVHRHREPAVQHPITAAVVPGMSMSSPKPLRHRNDIHRPYHHGDDVDTEASGRRLHLADGKMMHDDGGSRSPPSDVDDACDDVDSMAADDDLLRQSAASPTISVGVSSRSTSPVDRQLGQSHTDEERRTNVTSAGCSPTEPRSGNASCQRPETSPSRATADARGAAYSMLMSSAAAQPQYASTSPTPGASAVAPQHSSPLSSSRLPLFHPHHAAAATAAALANLFHQHGLTLPSSHHSPHHHQLGGLQRHHGHQPVVTASDIGAAAAAAAAAAACFPPNSFSLSSLAFPFPTPHHLLNFAASSSGVGQPR